MGEHLPAVVAIAAAAAPPPRERRCHTARKEEAAEAADFRRRLYVYIPVEDVGTGDLALWPVRSQRDCFAEKSITSLLPL